jgi:phosphoenolpyruvate-protein kinase (PTS system EI component)
MLEVPSAVFEAEEILDAADFATIGTNDLVQFMLASERRTAEMLSEEAVLQPAVLRAIARVVQLAKERQKPLCVCGEAAGNPTIACLLVGLGIRQLSMSPVRSALVRDALRKQRLTELEFVASTVLRLGSREQVANAVNQIRR